MDVQLDMNEIKCESAVGSNRQTPLKRKSSMKNLDSSRSQRIGSNFDSNDGDFEESPRDRSVRFSSVDVRDYSLCLGDNPSVSRGFPISLDWDYDEEHSHEINNYEHDRFGVRRVKDELKVPSLQRVQLLKKLGYSRGELNEHSKEINRVKECRFATRRSVEREDYVKALFRGMVKAFTSIACIFGPKKSAQRYIVTKSEKSDATLFVEPEDDTLASSTSTKNSELSSTEHYGSFPSSNLHLAEGTHN